MTSHNGYFILIQCVLVY